ncbi:hypothetical protein BG011_005215 [Mortierella polycephala]|uniref:Uncharacterized protein n=1 Tax=Mortierella polycephala TaxID=41804 RepID=A0A9P6PW44_9FUNG|nr:hypothetical protein BG011_005215 [Mortierella polycephala]
MDIGFRVQYSDLAMLAWVQLQILDVNDNITVENIDNSSRTDWDDTRSKNLTWNVPSEWATNDYTLRAHGDAYFRCTKNNVATFCPLRLEDRETLHVRPLPEGQKCPSSVFSSSTSPSATANSTLNLDANITVPQEAEKTIDGTNEEGTTGFTTPLKLNMDPAVLNQDLKQLEYEGSSLSVKKIDSGAAEGGMGSSSAPIALLSTVMTSTLIVLVV